jgi:hypothetical protein
MAMATAMAMATIEVVYALGWRRGADGVRSLLVLGAQAEAD